MERQILHIDVNNAFLSWTAIDMLEKGNKKDIRTIPSVIGGDETQRRGIVLAKSNLAKKYGIITGEPLYKARKKCPSVEVYEGSYLRYSEYSNKLYKLLLNYTDKIERFSVDECFLDMTEYLMGDTLINKAKEISSRVHTELGFTVNIGVANNKLLAKMASDFEKPNKVHTLYNYEIKNKLWNLPVGELFMLGKKTAEKLEKMYIKTIGDLAKQDEKNLIKKFGKQGRMLWEYANGIDDSEVIFESYLPKGIGHSITLPRDTNNIEELNKVILALVEQVSYRLRKYKLKAYVVNVQIRTKDFLDYSHQKKLPIPTDVTKDIYVVSKELLKSIYKNRELRLVGVRVTELVNEEESQTCIFNNSDEEKYKKVDDIVDKIKDKYGKNSITLAGKIGVEEIVNLK